MAKAMAMITKRIKIECIPCGQVVAYLNWRALSQDQFPDVFPGVCVQCSGKTFGSDEIHSKSDDALSKGDGDA